MNAKPTQLIRSDSRVMLSAQETASGLSAADLREIVNDFFSRLSERTQRTYNQGLRDFGRFLGEGDTIATLLRFFGLNQVEAYRCALQYQNDLRRRGLSPGTINTRLTALRALNQFMQVVGAIGWELKIKNVRSEGYRDTSGPSQDNFLAMLKRARGQSHPAKAKRDTAILMLHRYLGLRRGAIVNLDCEDLDLAQGTVLTLEKGEREKRLRSLPDGTKTALQAWIEERGDHPGALFTNFHHDLKQRKRISGTGVYLIVRGFGKQAGIKTRPHAIRHSGVTDLLSLTNGNITGVQQWAGHKDVRTTCIYNDNRTDEAGRLAKLLEDWDQAAVK